LTKDVSVLLALKGMKKNHLLKLALIVAFIGVILNSFYVDGYRAFMDGYNNSSQNTLHHNRDVKVLIDGNNFISQNKGIVRVDSLHRLEDIKISAWLVTNNQKIPLSLNILDALAAIAGLYILVGILRRTYKVINAISNNEAFEQSVIDNLNRIAYYFLAGFVLGFIVDRVTMAENSIMAGPKLHLLYDADWQMDFLVAGFLVLLIARAFEQGMKLNEEQKLTI
jgi:hypothetical protein